MRRAGHTSRAAGRVKRRMPGWPSFAAFGVYLVFAVYLTWPLVTDLGGSVYLFQGASPRGGDLMGSIAHLRELVDGHHNPFGPGRIEDFNAPDGLEIRWALNLASFASVSVMYVLALAVGPTAAHGLFILFGYAFSGLAMFLFVRRLTGHLWISLLLGWAFAFYPFAVVTAEHSAFVHGWPFVLLAWRVLEIWERPTLRNGLWAGAAAIIALAWTPHYFVVGGVTYAALTATAILGACFGPSLRRHVAAHGVGVALSLSFVIVLTWLVGASGSEETLPSSSLTDLASTSARPLMYLIPSADTLVGGHMSSLLAERDWLGVERTLYLGWTVMLLALVAIAAVLLRRLEGTQLHAAALSAAVTVAALLFAAPPDVKILGATVHFPSWFVYQVTPGVRLLSRFVIPLMAALCVLAALGLLILVRSLPARGSLAVLVLATVLVPVDLWNRFPDASMI